MKLYTRFDLHSSNNYHAIVDEKGKKVYKKKLQNDPDCILTTLMPHKDNIENESKQLYCFGEVRLPCVRFTCQESYALQARDSSTFGA